MMRLIIGTILFVNMGYSQTPVKLREGEYSPFTGVLMNESDFIEASNARRSLRLNDLRIQNMEEMIKTQESIIKTNYNKVSQLELEKERLEVDKKQSLIVGYLVGTLSTILIAYTVTRK